MLISNWFHIIRQLYLYFNSSIVVFKICHHTSLPCLPLHTLTPSIPILLPGFSLSPPLLQPPGRYNFQVSLKSSRMRFQLVETFHSTAQRKGGWRRGGGGVENVSKKTKEKGRGRTKSSKIVQLQTFVVSQNFRINFSGNQCKDERFGKFLS